MKNKKYLCQFLRSLENCLSKLTIGLFVLGVVSNSMDTTSYSFLYRLGPGRYSPLWSLLSDIPSRQCQMTIHIFYIAKYNILKLLCIYTYMYVHMHICMYVCMYV